MGNKKKLDYIFASARVRSCEKNLLTHERVERMLSSKTPADAMKLLQELEYGDISEPLSANQFEELLTAEHKKTYDFIMSIAPNSEEFLLFLCPVDYHNLKTLMKAEFLGINGDATLMNTGTIDALKLKVMVRDRNFSDMDEIMKTALAEVIDQFSRTGDPQIIDLIFDNACYASMSKAAANMGNDFVRGYVELLIDLINLKTFVRLRQINKSWDFFSKVFIPGGKIQEKVFISSYDEPLGQFAEKLMPFGLFEVLSLGNVMLKETGGFTALEKACDNQITRYIRAAKFVSVGIEPLVAFLLAKESEIKTARIIMAGKLAGLPVEIIGERLRETYV